MVPSKRRLSINSFKWINVCIILSCSPKLSGGKNEVRGIKEEDAHQWFTGKKASKSQHLIKSDLYYITPFSRYWCNEQDSIYSYSKLGNTSLPAVKVFFLLKEKSKMYNCQIKLYIGDKLKQSTSGSYY